MRSRFANTTVVHNAGLDGFGGSSMLDGVICRYKDSTSVFAHASDGVLEEKVYICQNFRGDVSAIVTSDGKMKEWVKYSAYGIPFAMPAGDTDSDGDCDTTDVGQILTWKNGSVYDVRGDLDLDGDVDATDRTTAISSYQGTTLGWGILSNIGNRKGYAGYERDVNFGKLWHVRNRMLDSELGLWTRRDPKGHSSESSLYDYVGGRTLVWFDPDGLTMIKSASILPNRSKLGNPASSVGCKKSLSGQQIDVIPDDDGGPCDPCCEGHEFNLGFLAETICCNGVPHVCFNPN